MSPLLQDLGRSDRLIAHVVDLAVLPAQPQARGPDVVEPLAEREPPAEAAVAVIEADAVAQVEFSAKAVRLVEQPGVEERDAGVARLCPRLQADAQPLAG